MKLKDMVYVLRSKNAGVWHITIDIIFKNGEFYQIAKQNLNKELFCGIYNKKQLEYFECDSLNTIKISFLREISAGSINDTDCLGALWYIPLCDIEINATS